MYFDHIDPLLTPLRSTSHFPTTQHCGLNSFKPVKSSLCCPHALRWMTVQWSMVGPQRAMPSSEIDSPSLRSYQLPIALQLGVGLHAPILPLSMLGFCLAR